MTKKILIVDDSESIRDVVNYTLETNGHNVLVGIDGKDAMKHLNGQHIDLIITDLYMPNMDGISLIKHIRQNESYKRTPILFLTTESQQDKKMEAKSAGATGWIVKPFIPENLISVINKVLR
ncbi:MAG: response regulator [Bacteroidales bacterium]|nr:MAG: response regulator [Bacteroidales bacterium]